MSVRSVLESLPGAGSWFAAVSRWIKPFKGSADYWERRYAAGRNSGAGSYNRLSEFKANYLNDFVSRNDIRSIIEFGSGDGSQLARLNCPDYIGVDVSKAAVELTRSRFASDPTKRFYEAADLPKGTNAELSLSLDVVYHLVEDEVYDSYMRELFDAATRFVIVYSSNVDSPGKAPHIRHRRFTDWVKRWRPEFALIETIPNTFRFDSRRPNETSFADFFAFERSQPV